jgi:hypothetical protein
MRGLSAACLVLGFAGLTSSCLLAEPPSGHMTAPVPADDMCTRYAQLICDGFIHCCDDPAILAAAPPRDTCVQMVQSSCTSGTYSLSMLCHDPRTGYDPIVAGQVLGTYGDYIDACDPSVMTWSVRRDGFEEALQGTVANGQPCLNGNPLSEYPAFLSCEDFSQACILTGLTTGNCTARHPLGQSCVLDLDCQDGLYCAGNNCSRLLANGAVCGGADGSQHHGWCQSSFCFQGRCETPTRTHVYCGGGVL